MIPCALGGIPPGAEGLEHDGTCHLYQWNKIRKLLSSAMKMRKRSPLIPLGMQRMNCYALMSFMTWR